MLKLRDLIPLNVSYRERLWHERAIKRPGYDSRRLTARLKLFRRYRTLVQSLEHK